MPRQIRASSLAHIGGITKPFMEKHDRAGRWDRGQDDHQPQAVVPKWFNFLLGGQIDAAYSGGIHNKNPEQWEVLGSFNAKPVLPVARPTSRRSRKPALVMAMPAKVTRSG